MWEFYILLEKWEVSEKKVKEQLSRREGGCVKKEIIKCKNTIKKENN